MRRGRQNPGQPWASWLSRPSGPRRSGLLPRPRKRPGAAAVREAFDEASRYSDRVLVEKFVDGLDYRLSVFRGQLIWATERTPGGVIGDGRSTVRELVDQLNADPARADHPSNSMRQLAF